MKNSELRQLVFDKIESLGYKITNVTHPDGYFICDYGEDSVTHFYLKGHFISKHWKFGLWVEEKYFDSKYVEKCKTEYNMKDEDMHVIQLFAQYDTCIDKFKPTRSALCLSWDLDNIRKFINKEDMNYKNESYTFNQIEVMLKFMCRHPLLAYNEFCGEYVGYYSGSFLWNFIKYESYDKRKKVKKALLTAYWLPWTKFKCWLAAKDPCIHELKLEDFEKENPGWSTSYLYEVQYVFTEEATYEQECAWLNKWWHRDDYGKFDCYDHIIHVDCCRKVGYDGHYSYS